MKKSYVYKMLGVTKQTFWNWEKGKSAPDYESIQQLAKILQVEINEISDLKEQQVNKSKNISTLFTPLASNKKLSLTKFKELSKVQKTIQQNINNIFSELNHTNIIIETLFNHLDILFYIKDCSLKYIGANTTFLKAMQLDTCKSISKLHDQNVMNKQDALRNTKEDRKVIFNKKTVKYEGYIPNTRKTRWGIITKTPIIDQNNTVIGLVATFSDITERKKAENRASIFEECINKLPVSLLIKEKREEGKKKFLYINKNAEQLTGYTIEQLKNSNLYTEDIDFWYTIPKNLLESIIRKRELNSGKEEHVEEFTVIRNSDQKKMDLRRGIYLNGNTIIEIIRDITEYKNNR